jgi:8-oxo-dGTP pyrophosphatase MutT (NUDIX family)
MAALTLRLKPRFGDLKLRWDGPLSDPDVVMQYITLHRPEWTTNPCLWISLAGQDRDHINFFLTRGFKMHRIKRASTIVLNLWLKDTPSTLPPGPFGYVGCGALVMNDKNEVLAVRENYAEGPGPWKLPGGLFDPIKDKKWSDGAVRECFEETGIRAEFQFIACERLMVNSSMYHQPDLYVVCRLKPLTTEIHFDPVEIAACQWLDRDQLIRDTHPMAAEFTRVSCYLEDALRERELETCTIYHRALDQ